MSVSTTWGYKAVIMMKANELLMDEVDDWGGRL